MGRKGAKRVSRTRRSTGTLGLHGVLRRIDDLNWAPSIFDHGLVGPAGHPTSILIAPSRNASRPDCHPPSRPGAAIAAALTAAAVGGLILCRGHLWSAVPNFAVSPALALAVGQPIYYRDPDGRL
jgi:hypothetical protein